MITKFVNLPLNYTSWLTLNRDCQLRCKWCYARKSNFRARMSDENFERSCSLLKELEVKNVTLIGGEPTIDPSFLKKVKALKELGFFVSVVSNGVRFSDNDFLLKSVKAGIGNVIISLKGSSRKEYIENTTKDVFKRVMEGLKNLQTLSTESGDVVNFNILVTLCGSMGSNFDKLISTIIRSGVKKVMFDTERPVIDGFNISYCGPSPKQMVDFLVKHQESIDSLRASGVEYCIYITHPFCLFPGGYIEMLEKSGRLVSGCQLHQGNGIIIDEGGNILPCNHFCENRIGSLKDCTSKLEYIALRNSKTVKKFYDLAHAYPAKKCVDCERWGKCGAGCRVLWLKFDENHMIF